MFLRVELLDAERVLDTHNNKALAVLRSQSGWTPRPLRVRRHDLHRRLRAKFDAATDNATAIRRTTYNSDARGAGSDAVGGNGG